MTTKKEVSIQKGMANIEMPVVKVKTTDLFIDPTIKVPTDKEYTILRDHKIYGHVSEGYSLINPSDFHNEMMNEFALNNINPEPNGFFDARGNWQIRYVVKGGGTPQNWNVGDEINPFVSFGNGIAGTKSGFADGGALRLICTNGMSSNITKEIFAQKVRNTENTQNKKLGVDFKTLIQKYLRFFESFDFVVEEQLKLIGQEFKIDQLLPVMYEMTKGTKFPTSQFQVAFDTIASEAKELGYTSMNRYLAYAGLNYILEHDSKSLDLNSTKEIDSVLARNIHTLSIPQAMKNFNALVKKETERIELYKASHEGKEPRGKRPILELDTTAFN